MGNESSTPTEEGIYNQNSTTTIPQRVSPQHVYQSPTRIPRGGLRVSIAGSSSFDYENDSEDDDAEVIYDEEGRPLPQQHKRQRSTSSTTNTTGVPKQQRNSTSILATGGTLKGNLTVVHDNHDTITKSVDPIFGAAAVGAAARQTKYEQSIQYQKIQKQRIAAAKQQHHAQVDQEWKSSLKRLRSVASSTVKSVAQVAKPVLKETSQVVASSTKEFVKDVQTEMHKKQKELEAEERLKKEEEKQRLLQKQNQLKEEMEQQRQQRRRKQELESHQNDHHHDSDEDETDEERSIYFNKESSARDVLFWAHTRSPSLVHFSPSITSGATPTSTVSNHHRIISSDTILSSDSNSKLPQLPLPVLKGTQSSLTSSSSLHPCSERIIVGQQQQQSHTVLSPLNEQVSSGPSWLQPQVNDENDAGDDNLEIQNQSYKPENNETDILVENPAPAPADSTSRIQQQQRPVIDAIAVEDVVEYQPIVNTPFGKGLVLGSRYLHDDDYNDERNRNQTKPISINEVRLIGNDSDASTTSTTKAAAKLYTPNAYPSIEPTIGDHVQTSYGQGIVTNIRRDDDENGNTIYVVQLSAWKLAGNKNQERRHVTCYFS